MWFFFFFSSRRRHTRSKRDWSSDVCSSDLIGNRPHPLVARDSEPYLVLDADQICKPLRAFARIRVLDHHGRLEIAAVRNERVVSGELLPDTLFLEDPLDAQHFLHLVTDGELVLEDKSDVLAEMNRAVLLMRNDLRPELL